MLLYPRHKKKDRMATVIVVNVLDFWYHQRFCFSAGEIGVKKEQFFGL